MTNTAILLILLARSIDLSALERVSNASGAKLSSFESMLLWSSVVLGVGVLIESWPEAIEFWHEWRWPMASFPRKTFWKLVGATLVAAGVIGEFWYTGQISSEETTLRTTSGQIEVELRKETADANERARNLENSTTQLNIELTRQELATAEAAKEAALANAKLGGWQLNDEAKRRFAKQVEGFKGTPFDLAVNPIEAPFMEQLDALLTSSSVGWVRLPPKPNGTLMAILVDGKATIVLTSGIMLEVDSDQAESLKPALIGLGTALHEELHIDHVQLHLVPPGSWGKRIHIIIGRRQ